MNNTVFDIKGYEPKSGDIFFFDNNIWMFLFAPIISSHTKKQQLYANFYQKVLQSKATIIVTPLILSEFANSYINIEFGLWKSKNTGNIPRVKDTELRKKVFYKTSEFKTVTDSIKSCIQNILKYTERVSDNFNAIEFPNVLEYFGESDFNDSYYIELARYHHALPNPNLWKIVTDDADLFKINKKNIPIYSANI